MLSLTTHVYSPVFALVALLITRVFPWTVIPSAGSKGDEPNIHSKVYGSVPLTKHSKMTFSPVLTVCVGGITITVAGPEKEKVYSLMDQVKWQWLPGNDTFMKALSCPCEVVTRHSYTPAMSLSDTLIFNNVRSLDSKYCWLVGIWTPSLYQWMWSAEGTGSLPIA